jgi:ribosomal protein S20
MVALQKAASEGLISKEAADVAISELQKRLFNHG